MKVIILGFGVSLNTMATSVEITMATFNLLADDLVVLGTAHGAIVRHVECIIGI
jgi:hypothetical protein